MKFREDQCTGVRLWAGRRRLVLRKRKNDPVSTIIQELPRCQLGAVHTKYGTSADSRHLARPGGVRAISFLISQHLYSFSPKRDTRSVFSS